MHIYTYVSVTVTLLSTAALHIILRKNVPEDSRYHIGLGLSAVISVTASLLLPDIVSVFTVDLAMQIALSFFIAFLIYITLLFISMMLVSSIFTPKRLDRLKKKWEDLKLRRQAEKELAKKHAEEKAAAECEKDHENSEVLSEQSGSNMLEQSESIETGNFSAGYSFKKETEPGKNIDTPDIIDKMELDDISNESIPYLDLDGFNLNELINRAFTLKQDGRELEAASLFIKVLDMKPDNEAAFWIVLDLCAIYKNVGQAELAKNILQSYLDRFELLMSNEVKDQIMQGLNT